MLIALTFLLSTASAADTQTTAISGQVEVNTLGTLMARQQALEAELAAAKTKCPVVSSCPAPAPKPKAPAKTKAASVPAPVVPDPKIAQLEQEIQSLKDQIAAIPAPLPPTPAYDDTALSGRVQALEQKPAPVIPAPYDDAVLAGRVTALEQAPAPVATHTESYVSNFHPSAYGFVTANFAAPYPGHEDIVGGRIDVGARFLWETPKNLNLGIAIEGGPSTFIGWGVRGGPELTTDVGFGDVSFAAGVGYDCTDLGGLGCEAEHTGGFANVGWEYGEGVLSFGVRAGMQLAWVTTSAAPEGFYDLNGTVGIGGYFGSLHPKGY